MFCEFVRAGRHLGSKAGRVCIYQGTGIEAWFAPGASPGPGNAGARARIQIRPRKDALPEGLIPKEVSRVLSRLKESEPDSVPDTAPRTQEQAEQVRRQLRALDERVCGLATACTDEQ